MIYSQRISIGSVDSLCEIDHMDDFVVPQNMEYVTPTNPYNPPKPSKTASGQTRKAVIQRLSGKSLGVNDIHFFQQLMSRGVSCDDMLMKAIVNTSKQGSSSSSDLHKNLDKTDEGIYLFII